MDSKYDDSKYNKYGINKKKYDLLFSDEDNIRKMDFEEKKRSYVLLWIIEQYTRLREKSIFSSLLKLYFGYKAKFDFSKIVWNENNKEYEFELLGEKYTFNKLSNFVDDKELKKNWNRKKDMDNAIFLQ